MRIAIETTTRAPRVIETGWFGSSAPLFALSDSVEVPGVEDEGWSRGDLSVAVLSGSGIVKLSIDYEPVVTAELIKVNTANNWKYHRNKTSGNSVGSTSRMPPKKGNKLQADNII
jgi:hypothetical protein